MNMPKWARIAVYGAVVAVAVDYFIRPTLNKSIQMPGPGDILTAPLDGPLGVFDDLQSTVTGKHLPLPGNIIQGAVGKGNDALVPDEKTSISSILASAGFKGQALTTATAIAMAESGGDPNVDNGICCVGLMQIHRVHAGIAGSPKDPAAFTEWLKDPYNNAKAAYAIYQGAGNKFTDWETYTNGAYRKFLGKDMQITTGKRSVTGEVNDAARSVVPGLATVEDLVSTILSPDTWFRIGKTGLGLTLVVLGTGAVLIIAANKASSSGAVVGAVKTASKIAK